MIKRFCDRCCEEITHDLFRFDVHPQYGLVDVQEVIAGITETMLCVDCLKDLREWLARGRR